MNVGRKDIEVRLYPAGLRERRVKLHGVHIDMQNHEIGEMLSKYGKVLQVTRERHQASFENEYYDCYTGLVTVRMEINTHVMSSFDLEHDFIRI